MDLALGQRGACQQTLLHASLDAVQDELIQCSEAQVPAQKQKKNVH